MLILHLPPPIQIITLKIFTGVYIIPILTQEQAIDIIRIWYIIEHRANPLTIKKCCFLLQILKTAVFSKIFRQGASPPVEIFFKKKLQF